MHAYHDPVWKEAGVWPYYSHVLASDGRRRAEPGAPADGGA